MGSDIACDVTAAYRASVVGGKRLSHERQRTWARQAVQPRPVHTVLVRIASGEGPSVSEEFVRNVEWSPARRRDMPRLWEPW